MPTPPEILSEYEIQCKIFDRVNDFSQIYPELLFLIGSLGGIRLHIGSVAKAQRAGCLKKGYPDLTLPVPRKGYCGLFIELKTEKGKLSKEQKSWLNALNNFGYLAKVCYGLDNAWDTLINYVKKENKS